MTKQENEEDIYPLKFITEHRQTVGEVASALGCQVNEGTPSSSHGLSQEQVILNRAKYGSNQIPRPKRRHPLLIYLSYMRNLFSVVLILAGLMSLVVFILKPTDFPPLYVGIIFILVAFFNAFLEFYQEVKSQQILEGFRSLMEQTTKVIREGSTIEVNVDDVVVGDILILTSGDTVPADSRLLEAVNLKVDMSSLTGESVPVERDSHISDTTADKAKNLLFKGSAITSGKGVAFVIRVGHKTLIGTIMRLSAGELVETGELGKELAVLIRRIVALALLTGSIFMGVAFIQNLGVIPALETGIGIFVAFLPQGLPMTITILLTTAAKRMAAKQVIVKNLQAVETLGSLTVIATDKTGTLTKNQMEVVGGWNLITLFDETSDEDLEQFKPIHESFIRSTSIRLPGDFDFTSEGLSKIFSDATELGLMRFAFRFGPWKPPNLVYEIPFDSARKWNLAVDEDLMMSVKGAPDKLLNICEVDETFKKTVNEAYSHFAEKGHRLIGFATKSVNQSELDSIKTTDPSDLKLTGFKFLGILSMVDPPKPGVKEAVQELKSAGIRVFMVTGDHPITATSIAKQVHIIEAEPVEINSRDQIRSLVAGSSVVLHGDLVDELGDEDWTSLFTASKEIVFARTLPRHKLIIVKAIQAQGEIVAAIGDGVNDSPAIKKANLGISMNKTGSDISKDAASMVLLDDRFPTIVQGVREGRLIFQNLKKSIRYTLTHIFPEVAAFSAWVLFLIPPPLTPILVLMIDVGSELGPALSYAYEQPELDLLKLQPRKRLKKRDSTKNPLKKVHKPFKLDQIGEALIDKEMVRWVYLQGGIIEAIGCFGAYIITFAIRRVPLRYLWRSYGKYFIHGAPSIPLTNGQGILNDLGQISVMNQAQSSYYLSIIIGQLFNLFVTKRRYKSVATKALFENRKTYLGMASAGIVGSLVVFVPGLQKVFGTYYPPAVALAAPVVTGLFMIAYEFLRHKINNRNRAE